MRKVLTMPVKPASRQKKSWSHQHDLTELKGKEIAIRINTGETLVGTLEDADQFTVKINQNTSMLSPVVVFKSAVTYFRAHA